MDRFFLTKCEVKNIIVGIIIVNYKNPQCDY